MKKLPVRAGVGLVVLNSPLPQVSNRFKSLFPQICSNVEKLLYVHILPGSNAWPPKALNDTNDSTGNNEVASWTNVTSRIYNHGSLVKSSLDLRLILHGVKTSIAKENAELRTKHKIDVIFFDPSIEAKWIQEYTNTCLTQTPSQPPDTQPKRIQLDLPTEIDDENMATYAQVKPTDKMYQNIVLGGTFDRIHAGHKILFTTSLLRCKNEITVGVTDGDMTRKKVLPELIQPCQQRIDDVREFLQDVDHTLKEYRIVPILDPFGPSIEDSTLQLIVGSQETEKGCLKVNQLRNERGLPQLDIHVIDLVDDNTIDEASPENDGKVSSSTQRLRLLGSELKVPDRIWERENAPYLIGLTGGSCSGKTNISKYLETLGAGVVNCDSLGHDAYAPGTTGFDKVVEAFGNDVIADNGTIDRKKLGSKVFGQQNQPNMHKLNEIVWPEIWKMAETQIAFKWKNENKKVVIIDAAVLLQAGWKEKVNQLWVSIVDTESAVQRIIDRDGKSEDEARQRLSSQTSNQKYVDEANIVFCSKWESSYTRKQVDKAWEYLQQTYLSE